MNLEPTAFSPTLAFLSETDKQKIYHAAFQVLEHNGLTGSLEMIVIMDEVIDEIRRIQKGIEINEDHLAVEVIGQGGRQGQFLTHPHTLKHLRSTQWRPNLLCRRGYERWSVEGKTSLMDRAHDRLNRILDTHTAKPMDQKMAGAVEAVVSGYR